jgi:hypothetical protein
LTDLDFSGSMLAAGEEISDAEAEREITDASTGLAERNR